MEATSAPKMMQIMDHLVAACELNAIDIQWICREMTKRPVWAPLFREKIKRAKATLQTTIEHLDEADVRLETMPATLTTPEQWAAE